jgi:hypothetical protein
MAISRGWVILTAAEYVSVWVPGSSKIQKPQNVM